MRRIIVLDSGPLGMISNPRASSENDEAKARLFVWIDNGDIVVLPEIADYEVRRELIRSEKFEGILSLDLFKASLEFLPIDSETMLDAAHLWAEARNVGKPATNNLALDGDMILVAQARAATRVWGAEAQGGHTVLATTNVKHLTNFCDARLWRDIE